MCPKDTRKAVPRDKFTAQTAYIFYKKIENLITMTQYQTKNSRKTRKNNNPREYIGRNRLMAKINKVETKTIQRIME